MGVPCKDPQAAAGPGAGISMKSLNLYLPISQPRSSDSLPHEDIIVIHLFFYFLECRFENVDSSQEMVGGVSALTSLSLAEVSRFRTSFSQKPQSLYTHQFVTWANSAIRSSLLSCKIKVDRRCTSTRRKGTYHFSVPTVELEHSHPRVFFPLHPALKG